MARILTVDDSRAVRSIVTRQMTELGFECHEAEDGELGLARLEECTYDLVMLDVTMPVLDGPGMLARMRQGGNQTPVIMLTSESRKMVMVEVIKLGVNDYILKPFKHEELRAKVQKILGGSMPAPGAGMPLAAPPPVIQANGEKPTGAGRQIVDVLVVDDMENVHNKLRTMLPPHMTMLGSVSAQSALVLCREKVFRVALIDTDIPDVNSATLMNQLRVIQPNAVFLALALRSANDVEKTVREQGFTDLLFKPFDKDSMDEFLARHFDARELVTVEDDVVKVGDYSGREDRIDRYFTKLNVLLGSALEKIAAACYDDAIVDMSLVTIQPDKTPRLLLEVDKRTRGMGLTLRLVGTPEVKSLLSAFADTQSLSIFGTVAEARAHG